MKMKIQQVKQEFVNVTVNWSRVITTFVSAILALLIIRGMVALFEFFIPQATVYMVCFVFLGYLVEAIWRREFCK